MPEICFRCVLSLRYAKINFDFLCLWYMIYLIYFWYIFVMHLSYALCFKYAWDTFEICLIYVWDTPLRYTCKLSLICHQNVSDMIRLGFRHTYNVQQNMWICLFKKLEYTWIYLGCVWDLPNNCLWVIFKKYLI